MPRKPLIRTNVFPYHVTGRGNNREIFPCDSDLAWKIFESCLMGISEVHGVKIHSFVLMPNHFHLLISTPKDDLGKTMQTFMRLVTRRINFKTGRVGRVFGARYHWTLVNDLAYLDSVVKYIYRNPVKSGLVPLVELYRYSTIRMALAQESGNIPLSRVYGLDSLIPNDNKESYLEWLNTPYASEEDTGIKKAMKRSVFVPKLEGWRRRKIRIHQKSDLFKPDLDLAQ